MVYRGAQLAGAAGIPVALAAGPYRVALGAEVVDDSPHRWPRYLQRLGDLTRRDRVVLVAGAETSEDRGGVGLDGCGMVGIGEAR